MMRHDGFSATAGALVNDECNLLWQEFDSISIKHCNQQSNKVAHELAKCIKVIMHFVDEPPSFILEALVNDVTIFSKSIKCVK
jgi:hypothetical protein